MKLEHKAWQQLIEEGLITPKTNAIYDNEFIKALQKISFEEWFSVPKALRCRPQYLETYDQWIRSSQLNTITGLETYPCRDLTNGTTQCFDEFHFRHKERRLRVFKGEYRYHDRVVGGWTFLEDQPLERNDYVIISAPFCSTGEVHPRLKQILDQCLELGCPVLIDCAYFGTCHSFQLDVSHPAIHYVCFSLSKGTGMGDIRSGIRYGREEDNYPISQQNRYDHTVLMAARIGLHMMENFSPDFIPNKYRQAQETICQALDIQATPCMHLALSNQFLPEFHIDNTYFRLGIRELVKKEYRYKISKTFYDWPPECTNLQS